MYSLSKLSYLYIYFTAPIPKAYDPADYYFVGALIALSSAIFSAANNIVILSSGVPILHVIATPFPKQWHKIGDNLNTVHFPTVEKLNKIFRLFVAEYLQLPTQL